MPPSIPAGSSTSDRRTGGLHEFVIGLTRPSVTSLVTAAGVVVTGLIACIFLLTPSRLVAGLDRFFDGGGDRQSLAITMKILERAEGGSPGPLLIVLGGSVAQGAVTEDLLRVELRESGREEWDVAELTSARQSLWEMGAILDQLPEATSGSVLLFVGPSRFTRTPSEIEELYRTPPLGIRSDFVDRAARRSGIDPPPRTGIYALDNRLFYQPRLTHALRALVKLAIGRPLPRRWEVEFDDRTLEGVEWEEMAGRVAARFSDYSSKVSMNLEVLDDLVACAEGRGMSVILAESPVNPKFVEEYLPERYAEYVARVADYARTRGLPYLYLQNAVGLRRDEFHDWAHLRNSAVGDRFTRVLADTLAALLPLDDSGMGSS